MLSDTIKDSYILCVCEGAAETDIINMLLDENKLLFKRDQLIGGKCTNIRAKKILQEKFLNYSYEKKVTVLRILDSENEKFKLDKAYVDRFEVLNVYTKPEIEILIIIDKNEYGIYTRKNNVKPSLYCKENYNLKDIKQKGFIYSYFNDVEHLINVIKKYNELHKKNKNSYNLYDLLL